MQVSAASVFGQMGAPGNAGYCSSKAAVIGVSRTAAKENPHLRINCVSPGEFVMFTIWVRVQTLSFGLLIVPYHMTYLTYSNF